MEWLVLLGKVGACITGAVRAGRLDYTLARLLIVLFALGGCAREPALTSSVGSNWMVPSNEVIRAMLAERMQHNGVGIVVGVIDANGRRIVTYGKSGASNARPLDGDTVFQIGSITKPFTTLLLTEMVERGQVKLDDPASKYLPSGVKMPQRGRPITLRDLATHTSGLPTMPNSFVLDARPDPYEAYSVDQLHEFLSTYSLEYAPGEARSYSNLGVALLGRLLANASGVDYESLLTERVLNPLRMNSTSIKLSEDQRQRLVPGHDRYLQAVRTWEMATLPASGSLRSTANDMLNLVAAYLGFEDTPLKQAMNFQLQDHLPDTEGVQALAWAVRPDGTVQHEGGKQGYRSSVVLNPRTRVGAVVLLNSRTDDRPTDLARHLVTGEPLSPASPAPTKERIDVSPAALTRYEGIYEFSDGRMLEIASRGDHLLIRYPSGGILEFVSSAPNEFFYRGGNDDITFQEQEGLVTGLVLYGDGKSVGTHYSADRVE